ncbi:MAG: prolyl oligopeptidase family serine peptidase [Pseudomonadota bacterium]
MTITLKPGPLDTSLYGPADGAPAPGIVILHGSEGPGAGWSHRFAAILAAHGFWACPFGYGTGDVWGAGAIRDVDISVIPANAARIGDLPEITALHLLGWSRGGELAMHLAALGGDDLPFASIAAHAPADRVIGPFDAQAFRQGEAPASGRAWVWPGHEEALAPETAIAVENFSRPVFLSVGSFDEVWNPDMTRALYDRRKSAGLPTELYWAEGQGHAFDADTEPEFWRRLTAFFEKPSGL